MLFKDSSWGDQTIITVGKAFSLSALSDDTLTETTGQETAVTRHSQDLRISR